MGTWLRTTGLKHRITTSHQSNRIFLSVTRSLKGAISTYQDYLSRFLHTVYHVLIVFLTQIHARYHRNLPLASAWHKTLPMNGSLLNPKSQLKLLPTLPLQGITGNPQFSKFSLWHHPTLGLASEAPFFLKSPPTSNTLNQKFLTKFHYRPDSSITGSRGEKPPEIIYVHTNLNVAPEEAIVFFRSQRSLRPLKFKING